MINKIDGVSILKQREYMRAENQAYEALIESGFLPNGRTKNLKQVVVFKIIKEHENKEVFHFTNWQEAKESLC